jgi:hypothetical protein
MAVMKRGLYVAAGGVVTGVAAAVAVGALLWDRATASAVARMWTGLSEGPDRYPSPEDFDGVPAPVARYFAFALAPSRPLIRTARIEQEGQFRVGGLDAPWRRLRATEYFRVGPPGFVWDARVRMAPLLTVRVRDSYVGGVGAMRGRLAGVIPVTDQADTPELAAGALHRYLAEAAWFPTALLPSQGVSWEPIDGDSARATLTDGGTAISLEFRFNDRGEIVSAYTPARYRDVGGQAVPTPWECGYGDYACVDGVMVPMAGEAAWLLTEGRLTVYRGRLTAVAFDGRG